MVESGYSATWPAKNGVPELLEVRVSMGIFGSYTQWAKPAEVVYAGSVKQAVIVIACKKEAELQVVFPHFLSQVRK